MRIDKCDTCGRVLAARETRGVSVSGKRTNVCLLCIGKAHGQLGIVELGRENLVPEPTRPRLAPDPLNTGIDLELPGL